MTRPDFLDPRLTERRNPRSTDIDRATALEIIDLMNREDRTVIDTVHGVREEIAQCVDIVVERFKRGGRLIYVGAGTSGRLGVLDATECPPTFGTKPEMVVGVIAGGTAALTRSQEGAEDDQKAGAAAMDERSVGPSDFVLGIAASGTTPYVSAAVERALSLGAAAGLLTCAKPPEGLANRCDVVIGAYVGPEVLTGSTRLKAGTATKLILNSITTASMIRLGKAYGNLMVDLQAMSQKLVDRGERIVMETTGVNRVEARRAIDAAQGSVKAAIVMARLGVGRSQAQEALAKADGSVRRVIGAPPRVVGADGAGEQESDGRTQTSTDEPGRTRRKES